MKKLFLKSAPGFSKLAPDRPQEPFKRKRQGKADYENSAAALEEDGEMGLAFEERLRVEDLLSQRLSKDEADVDILWNFMGA